MTKLTKMEALAAIDASPVRAGQYWQHYKTRGEYCVIALGIAEATLSPVVIYSGHDGVVWVRELSVFLEKVKTETGQEPRFRLLLDPLA